MSRVWVTVWKWAIAAVVLVGLLAAAYVIHDNARARREEEGAGETVKREKTVDKDRVKLGRKSAQSYGVKVEAARAVQWRRRVLVYGRVVPNPQATAELRSPFAGTLRDPHPSLPQARGREGWGWPRIGQTVRKGQVLGQVDIRVGPQERLDLQARLNEARLKHQGAEDVLKVQQQRMDRLQKLSTPEIVSRKELDEALVQLTEARTQQATAKAALELWQHAALAVERQKQPGNSTWREALTAPVEGEVTELAGRPGMAVEAGGLIARIVDFRRPLVRLDFPPEALLAGPPPQVELMPLWALPSVTGNSLGTLDLPTPPAPSAWMLVGAAPHVDATSQFAAYWYEANLSAALATSSGGPTHTGSLPSPWAWRPGLSVKADIELQHAKPRDAVSVPRSALLVHQGRALVYVRVDPDWYEPREVQELGTEGDRAILASGVAADELVVYRHAQTLLSEQFQSTVQDND